MRVLSFGSIFAQACESVSASVSASCSPSFSAFGFLRAWDTVFFPLGQYLRRLVKAFLQGFLQVVLQAFQHAVFKGFRKCFCRCFFRHTCTKCFCRRFCRLINPCPICVSQALLRRFILPILASVLSFVFAEVHIDIRIGARVTSHLI